VAAGVTDASDFPVTTGVLQAKPGGMADGFVAKLNSSGTALLFSTYLGGSDEDRVNAAALDAGGNIWVTGETSSGDFPGTEASFTGSFVAQVTPDGARLATSQRAPAGAAGQAIRAGGEIAVIGASGSVLTVSTGGAQGASILGVASSAGDRVKGTVAPGEFVSLYGTNLRPGSQVLFNGIAAPVLYASEGQMNVLAPYGIAGNATVAVQAGDSAAVTLYVRPAQPEVFRSGTSALALNQDGSINSAQDPAAPGSIVTIFASGAGTLLRAFTDGSAPAELVGGPVLPVSVLLNGRSIEVTYAGNSPGQLVNLLQVNFRLPRDAGGGDFQLMVGGAASPAFSIAMQ
jgi:uncharacterized protein (TIGR03437 family)